MLVRVRAKRRPLTLAGAALLFVFVFFLVEQTAEADETIGLLYAVPVALVGLEFGLGAGFGAAIAALALSTVWAATGPPDFEGVGFATSAVALVSVGGFAGRFGDRTRAQAALRSELELSRQRVSEQLRSASRLLGYHEAERREIANQLHEQVAQTVAAALMALSLVEDDVEGGTLHRSQIESVRSHMRECLEDLRGLAASLRPTVLDELGLVSALERICSEEGERACQPIAMHFDGSLGGLPAGVEISAYRTVKEVLEALSGATKVGVSVDEGRASLRIAVTAALSDRDEHGVEEKVATARARLELLGGSLRTSLRPGEDGASIVTVIADTPLRPGEGLRESFPPS